MLHDFISSILRCIWVRGVESLSQWLSRGSTWPIYTLCTYTGTFHRHFHLASVVCKLNCCLVLVAKTANNFPKTWIAMVFSKLRTSSDTNSHLPRCFLTHTVMVLASQQDKVLWEMKMRMVWQPHEKVGFLKNDRVEVSTISLWSSPSKPQTISSFTGWDNIIIVH